MVYSLSNNVYLVNGAARSCIYDFNSGRLYSLSTALSEKVSLVNQLKVDDSAVSGDLRKVFDHFLELGLFSLSEDPISHHINEIRAFDSSCEFAWIEITTKCNLRCLHCYNESDSHRNGTMSLDDFKRVVNVLLELGVKKIQIIGGEPFVRRQFLRDALDYAIGKFQFIEIFTNGTLITDDWFEYLAKHDICIALSVYSYQAEAHDKVTGFPGSWIRTNQTIKALKKKGITYRVCNVLMDGVDIGEKTTDLYYISRDKDVVRMSGRASFSLLSDELIRKRLITKESFRDQLNKKFCSALLAGHNCFSRRIYISADLTVFPCVMERRLKHCVVGKDGKISLNDSIRHLNKDRIHECSQCEYRYACFDCRPNSLSGDLYEKPWYCTYNPLLGEWEDVNVFIERLKEKWNT